ncbi:hypothetical protein [Terrimonas alba]|uniref:hypothetical protein n=1 Tax=Terrimonas alba TaxID=3349636 RepID=UPI0035F44FD1
MTALRRYKHFLAAILLALYAFVATPVQLWHHHDDASTIPAATSSRDTNNESISKAGNAASENSCPVCSHKYSTYSNEAVVSSESFLEIPAAKNGYYCVPVISIPAFSLPNKGPPVLS